MLDEAHQCAGMKYLRNKPVKDLSGADFLKLVQAEGEGLLEVKISIDLDQVDTRRGGGGGGGGVQSFFEEIRQLFYRVSGPPLLLLSFFITALYVVCMSLLVCLALHPLIHTLLYVLHMCYMLQLVSSHTFSSSYTFEHTMLFMPGVYNASFKVYVHMYIAFSLSHLLY